VMSGVARDIFRHVLQRQSLCLLEQSRRMSDVVMGGSGRPSPAIQQAHARTQRCAIRPQSALRKKPRSLTAAVCALRPPPKAL
jgi:hypothetical protein